MKDFGSKIRQLRKEKQISIIQMANDISYSKSIINYWETNKKEPTISALYVLCKYFDVTADYLLGLTDY